LAVAAKVLQFARDQAKDSPLTKKLREIQRANDEFWSTPTPHLVQAGLAFAQLRKSQQRTKQKASAKQRSKNLADRDQRIRDLAAQGETPKEIGGAVKLSAARVRKILNRKTKTRV
jgi:hypothetical protein